MMIKFIHKAEFLKRALDLFYQTLERAENEATEYEAGIRLQRAVNQVEAFTEDHGSLWQRLPEA